MVSHSKSYGCKGDYPLGKGGASVLTAQPFSPFCHRCPVTAPSRGKNTRAWVTGAEKMYLPYEEAKPLGPSQALYVIFSQTH